MSKLPNLKHLQYLLALHKHQHFHRAAHACFVSQSTLSSAIIKLEEQFNCQLIERDNKAFIFTAHGNAIVEMARKILVSTHEMVDFAEQQGNAVAGTIRLGCIPTIAPYLLPDFVTSCQKNFPDLSLFLREDTTALLMTLLATGEVDMVILALPIAQHGFKSVVVGQDAFYMAGSAELLNLYSSAADYSQLPKQSIFLLSQEHCLTEHALSACKLADPSRINQFSASSITTLIQMTVSQNGFTFIPEMAIKKGVGINEGLVVDKMPQAMYREIGMLWRSTSMRQQTYLKLAAIVESLLR